MDCMLCIECRVCIYMTTTINTLDSTLTISCMYGSGSMDMGVWVGGIENVGCIECSGKGHRPYNPHTRSP